MKTRTILAYSLVMNAFVLSAASCSDDSEGPSGSAGKGGSSSGRGGEAGQAGEVGQAGQAGGAGAGAEGGMSAGTGGSGTGGTGTGGSGTGGAGTGGASTGGTSGTGSGGEQAGGAGEAGDGAGGDSTEGARSCQVGCQSQDDCASTTLDVRRCDLTSMRCVECTAHADCVPVASAWSVACDDDSGCFTDFGEVCVDVGGSGRCAMTPDSVVGCLFPGEVPLTYPKFGVSTPEMVDVCGKESGRCENNLCFTGCTDDPNFCTVGLNAGKGDTCDASSGRCTCAGDSECSQGPGHCNTTTHRCDECAGPADCTGVVQEGKDACVDGRCGCSDASVCPTATFPAGTPVCE